MGRVSFVSSIVIASLIFCLSLVGCINNEGLNQTAQENDGTKYSEPQKTSTAESSNPLLLGWSAFYEYWEKGTESNYNWIYQDSSGEKTYYKIKEGYEPGDGVKGAVLINAHQTEPNRGFNIIVVDCSTGEVSYWRLATIVKETIEAENANTNALAKNYLYRNGDYWLAYLNVPQVISPAEEANAIDDLVDTISIEESADYWLIATPEESKKEALNHNPFLRDYLIENYGEEIVAPYED